MQTCWNCDASIEEAPFYHADETHCERAYCYACWNNLPRPLAAYAMEVTPEISDSLTNLCYVLQVEPEKQTPTHWIVELPQAIAEYLQRECAVSLKPV